MGLPLFQNIGMFAGALAGLGAMGYFLFMATITLRARFSNKLLFQNIKLGPTYVFYILLTGIIVWFIWFGTSYGKYDLLALLFWLGLIFSPYALGFLVPLDAVEENESYKKQLGDASKIAAVGGVAIIGGIASGNKKIRDAGQATGLAAVGYGVLAIANKIRITKTKWKLIPDLANALIPVLLIIFLVSTLISIIFKI